MEVLSRTGIKVWEPQTLALLKEAGADVDEKMMNVRIPESLVKEAVSKAPSHFEMYGRDP